MILDTPYNGILPGKVEIPSCNHFSYVPGVPAFRMDIPHCRISTWQRRQQLPAGLSRTSLPYAPRPSFAALVKTCMPATLATRAVKDRERSGARPSRSLRWPFRFPVPHSEMVDLGVGVPEDLHGVPPVMLFSLKDFHVSMHVTGMDDPVRTAFRLHLRTFIIKPVPDCSYMERDHRSCKGAGAGCGLPALCCGMCARDRGTWHREESAGRHGQIVAESSPAALDDFIRLAHARNDPAIRVEEIAVKKGPATGEFRGFRAVW